MKTPTFQLAKNLSLVGLNLRPKSDFLVMHRFVCLADYRIFCNKVGVRLNYTNASCLIKYPEFGHKYKSPDRPEKKLKSRFQDMLGKHLYSLRTEINSALPILVECNRNISKSLDVASLIQNNNEKTETDYIKRIFPCVDDIQVKRFYEDGSEVLKKFNINSIFSNNAILLNAVPIPSSDIFKNVYSYNSSDSSSHINEINKGQDANSSNMGLERVLCSPASTGGEVPSEQQDPPKKGLGKPSEETLTKVSDVLSKELRSLFTKTMNYKMYTNDIIFENRIRGNVTVGLFSYIRQLSFLRAFAHFKFAFVEMEILKITQHSVDGTIRVRWRIVGSSGLKSLPFIFSLKSYSMKSAKDKMDTWFDGFSTFYVNEEGLIYKHVADNMMPDEEHLMEKKPTFMTRLAALIGRALRKPAPSPAVTTSVVDEPKDKKPSPLSGFGAQKGSVLLLVIGNKILDVFH